MRHCLTFFAVLIFVSSFSPASARIFTLTDPAPHLSNASTSPFISGTFPLTTDLFFTLRDPLRAMEAVNLSVIIPDTSKSLVTVHAISFSGSHFSTFFAEPELSTFSSFVIHGLAFPAPGLYALRAEFTVQNPEKPVWNDPASMTREREVEMIELGANGEIWGKDEKSTASMVADGVVVRAVGEEKRAEIGEEMDVLVEAKKEGPEVGWIRLGFEESGNETKYRIRGSWIPRKKTDKNQIDDKCKLLLLSFSRGDEAVMDLVATSKLAHADAYSPLQLTILPPSHTIARSNAAVPLHAMMKPGAAGFPDLCSRQVFKRFAESSIKAAGTFGDGVVPPWGREEGDDEIEPENLSFGPGIVVPVSMPEEGQHVIIVEARTEGGDVIVGRLVLGDSAPSSEMTADEGMIWKVEVGAAVGLSAALFAGTVGLLVALLRKRRTDKEERNAYTRIELPSGWSHPVTLVGDAEGRDGYEALLLAAPPEVK